MAMSCMDHQKKKKKKGGGGGGGENGDVVIGLRVGGG